MHPDVRSTAGGTCSICSMTLVPAAAGDAPVYDLDVRTGEEPVVPGRPFTLELTVREPETGTIIERFAEVHERQFHLFVISEDLEFYSHVHPSQRQDGSWALDLTLPKRGRYRVFADFRPVGGAPQVIARPLMTDGTAPDTMMPVKLTPDRELRQRAGGMTVALELPGGRPVAGTEQKFSYRLTDAATGAPVRDLEPYLGAWGHSLLLSEDMTQFVHAHPVESLAAGGGPALTFKAVLPAPGTYRIWTQLKRRGELATAVFTVTTQPTSAR
jgi:hypothetical protein